MPGKPSRTRRSPRPNPKAGAAAGQRKNGKDTPGTKGNGAPGSLPASDFRHKAAKRLNNPPAKIAGEGTVPAVPKARYAYSPHLAPILRFDPSADADRAAARIAALIDKAAKGALTDDERAMLREALDNREPWLEWATKREQHDRGGWFEVDPVALHIHERVSAQAILKVAARQDAARWLFADPEHEYHQAVQFYRHPIDWTNRLILGDSLQVMSSLARREGLAGKVQMIYMDPPYGIKFASNFQPEVGRRDVKDKDQDLTREPEMVRAYRDTWHLGIHSYLSYLRDRLILARELLADTGSIFVQISDENLHRVRMLLDEIFGPANFVSQIAFSKTSSATVLLLPSTVDHLMWYARSRSTVKYREIFATKSAGGAGGAKYDQAESRVGFRAAVSQVDDVDAARVFRVDNITSQSVGREKGEGAACWFPVELGGRSFLPSMRNRWKTNQEGLGRLLQTDRVAMTGESIGYVRFLDDFPAFPHSDIWMDIGGIQSRADPKAYVVQTATEAVKRCMLMTTDPGDLVLDPTCGSGTTAYVAEQWGRRWITIDTSRVAIAIARQRLLTARFDRFRVKGEDAQGKLGNGHADPSIGLVYRTVPHITLKSIAQNQNLDPIFARHEPILEDRLKACNAALAKVPAALRSRLADKLTIKERKEGKRAVTDADRRRWLLPPDNRDRSKAARDKATVDLDAAGWYHWEVPFDTDPDWPKPLADTVTAYRQAWRAKMDEVNACIAANADQEELVDQPEIVRGVTRVSGPFTAEAVQPPEMSLGDVLALDATNPDRQGGADAPGVGTSEFAGAPDALDATFPIRMVETQGEIDARNAVAYLKQMCDLIRRDGVRLLDNKHMVWSRLDTLYDSGGGAGGLFHAEGRWLLGTNGPDPEPDGSATVGVVFGPQYGPITAAMVEAAMRVGARSGYEHLLIAGFSFDGAASASISEAGADQGMRVAGGRKMFVHLSHISPTVNPAMTGLLKDPGQQKGGGPGGGGSAGASASQQLFTVFGQPRVRLNGPGKKGAEWRPAGADDTGQPPESEYTVTMEGVDIYDPVTNQISGARADKVAAWFLDSDYDGRTFCITQAFFPDRTAWEKLAKALNGPGGPIDAERFEALSGTTSLPFPMGKHGRVAVKVIDPRGNEVVRVVALDASRG